MIFPGTQKSSGSKRLILNPLLPELFDLQCFSVRKKIKVRNHLYQWFRTFVVRVARLELAASWSQTRRPTNWATPGY